MSDNNSIIDQNIEHKNEANESKSKYFRKTKFENRFNGLSENELKARTLPDHLDHNLDILIIGINPGYTAAFKGHHYAGQFDQIEHAHYFPLNSTDNCF